MTMEKHMTEKVTLRDICKELKLDPREARVKLRATGKRAPDGRWEWPKAQIASVKAILRGDAPAKKASAKKPVGHRPASKEPAPAASEPKPG